MSLDGQQLSQHLSNFSLLTILSAAFSGLRRRRLVLQVVFFACVPEEGIRAFPRNLQARRLRSQGVTKWRAGLRLSLKGEELVSVVIFGNAGVSMGRGRLAREWHEPPLSDLITELPKLE